MRTSQSHDRAAITESDRNRYILLTQCLQNDFFLNRECQIYLGDQSALGMLTARNERPTPERTDGRLRIPAAMLARGPLSLFLEATIGRRLDGSAGRSTLHVANIRDWHELGPVYDTERRRYGSHCEKGTWGAGYIDGLERFLDPVGGPDDQEASSFVTGSLRICHVHSDSVFDFRPREGADRVHAGKLPSSELEDLLDILVQGGDEHVRALDEILAVPTDPSSHELVARLARRVDDESEETPHARVYVAVIGAYSDVKVLTLLGGLRARYDLPNLALSDSLSGSPTLERHISGLDFANKVMDVEVIHGVNDLVAYLGGTPELRDESLIVEPNGFARYQTFFRDKQSVLAYQSERLQEYLALTERRSLRTYKWVEWSNLFLILCGAAFLVATLFFSVWAAVDPSVSWALPAVTGGIGLIQLVTVFFRQPMQDLNRNLANLMTYRMALESHSLKMALARFHLTTPHTLRDLREGENERAEKQVEVLRQELDVIANSDAIDFARLASLGFDVGPASRETNGATGSNGDGPAEDTAAAAGSAEEGGEQA